MNSRKKASGVKIEASASEARELLKYMSKYITLTSDETDGILKTLDIRKFEKGTVLLEEGQVAEECYFVLKGCVRQYFVIDGEEKTTNFFTEGMPVSTFVNSRPVPSAYYLSCLEDCSMTVGSIYDTQEELYNPRLAKVCLEAVEEELTNYQDILSQFKITNPEDRYLKLLKNRPELIDRVPQYYLASYLGMQPESLSRIRKRILVKKE